MPLSSSMHKVCMKHNSNLCLVLVPAPKYLVCILSNSKSKNNAKSQTLLVSMHFECKIFNLYFWFIHGYSCETITGYKSTTLASIQTHCNINPDLEVIENRKFLDGFSVRTMSCIYTTPRSDAVILQPLSRSSEGQKSTILHFRCNKSCIWNLISKSWLAVSKRGNIQEHSLST